MRAHGNRLARCIESARVAGGIDAAREAACDDEPGTREPRCELARRHRAGGGAAACADDGNLRRTQRLRIALHPQHGGRRGDGGQQLRGIARIRGRQELQGVAVRDGQILIELAAQRGRQTRGQAGGGGGRDPGGAQGGGTCAQQRRQIAERRARGDQRRGIERRDAGEGAEQSEIRIRHDRSIGKCCGQVLR